MIDRKPAGSEDADQERDEQQILREEQAYEGAQRESGPGLDVRKGFGLETFEAGMEG